MTKTGAGTAEAGWVLPRRSDADEEKRVGRAVSNGIMKNYKRLRTQGLSPQQLLVASIPTTTHLLTMSTSCASSAYLWSLEHNTQWDLWQSPVINHGSIHCLHSLCSAHFHHSHRYPSPHSVCERAVKPQARDDNFSNANFHNQQWAYSIGLDAKMEVFKTCPQE